jgi:hypothetical protein
MGVEHDMLTNSKTMLSCDVPIKGGLSWGR